jgi:predicted transcriptional regulator
MHETNEVQDLLEQLIAQGKTETEVAAQLGVSQAAVYYWRHGQRVPPLKKLVIAELKRMLRQAKRERDRKAPAGTTPAS